MRPTHVAGEVTHRDGMDLRLRVGLNSGQVIAGEIGSGALGYTAIGEQVGMAQRMESAAPPGGVMLSESTARLVEGAVMLADPELVHIKGARDPVPARRLDRHRRRSARAQRPNAGRAHLGTQHHRRDPRRGDRWGRLRHRCPGPARYRQEPHRARSRGDRRRPRCPGFHHLLRIPHQRHSLPCGDGPVARGAGCRRARRRSRRGRSSASALPTPTPKICCLLDDLLGIADPDVEVAQHRGRCPAAAAHRADQRRIAGPHRSGAVRDRGRALDRRGQRIDAGRLSSP